MEEEEILEKREEWKSEILNMNNQQAEIPIGIMLPVFAQWQGYRERTKLLA